MEHHPLHRLAAGFFLRQAREQPTVQMNHTLSTRQEADFLGTVTIPAGAYWGIHTARALENFPISGQSIGNMPELVRALAHIKMAAAQANEQLGVVAPAKAKAIVGACEDILAGLLHDQFVVDVIQGGAGTSTNMNVNEVIANRALESLGWVKGDYAKMHPNDDVNASQSTNDVYPTALRIAAWRGVESLLQAMLALRRAFERKAKALDGVLKIGRTQLQDAVPMTLGQELRSFAVTIAEDEELLHEAQRLLLKVNLGGTAVGTGINAPVGYSDVIIPILAAHSGVPLTKAECLIEATQDTGAFLQLSGVLKRIACKLSKICNDLRLLSSGPQAGFGDILLPARQAGSSIMPGKINPVIPEAMNQVAFEVIGNDLTITMAAQGGQLQLNAFEPIIGWSLHKSLLHLNNACNMLAHRCVQGIEPNYAQLTEQVASSVTVITALNPLIGYDASCRIVKQALISGETVAMTAERLGIMSAEQMQALLVPENLTCPVFLKTAHSLRQRQGNPP